MNASLCVDLPFDFSSQSIDRRHDRGAIGNRVACFLSFEGSKHESAIEPEIASSSLPLCRSKSARHFTSSDGSVSMSAFASHSIVFPTAEQRQT